MGNKNLAGVDERLTALEHRLKGYRYLCLGLGLLMVAGGSIAAKTASSTPAVIQANRLEVVDEAGRVVFSAGIHKEGNAVLIWNKAGKLSFGAYGTASGGRLEILDGEGQERFTVGKQDDQELPGLWERHLRAFGRQQRDVDQQRLETHQMRQQLHDLERPDRPEEEVRTLRVEIDRQGRELDQRRRELDSLSRHISSVERQLRALERR